MSNSQKRENILNLALDAAASERAKSLDLDTGYDVKNDSWTLIIKYIGALTDILSAPFFDGQVKGVELLCGYAVIEIPSSMIDYLTGLDAVIFVEKPMEFYFSGGYSPLGNICIEKSEGLSGEGVLTAVIDSGINCSYFSNYSNILCIWDQTGSGQPPEGYNRGRLYEKDEIHGNLDIDRSGHGTAVAGLAAALAPKSDFLMVKLPNSPGTGELMEAIDFCVRYARQKKLPLVINLSFGNTYGPHDGSSLLETYIDEVAGVAATTIVAGCGNEGDRAGHCRGVVQKGVWESVELYVAGYERSLNIQIWKEFADIFVIELKSPSGRLIRLEGKADGNPGVFRSGADDTGLLVYMGKPTPFSTAQEIYIEFLPIYGYIAAGIWEIRLFGEKIAIGGYDMWLPSHAAINGSAFVRPNPDTTLTIPSTAGRVISVAAYDSGNDAYAAFSGRGFDRNGRIKPDLAAPGVGIIIPGLSDTPYSGTSFAAPIVSGLCARLMEWGIVRKNDRYMYGEKVKAYFQRSARALRAEKIPDKKTGWGAACFPAVKV